MSNFDPEEWRQFGVATAQPHIQNGEYCPLLPNAPAFFENGVYLVSRYACYLRAYRREFLHSGIPVPRIKTIREVLRLEAPPRVLSSLRAA